MEQQLRLAKAKLRKLKESVEDLDDLLCLEKAKLRNAGKPSIAWEIVAKELGLRPPRKKRLGS